MQASNVCALGLGVKFILIPRPKDGPDIELTPAVALPETTCEASSACAWQVLIASDRVMVSRIGVQAARASVESAKNRFIIGSSA
jgi:hypothetical protein